MITIFSLNGKLTYHKGDQTNNCIKRHATFIYAPQCLQIASVLDKDIWISVLQITIFRVA